MGQKINKVKITKLNSGNPIAVKYWINQEMILMTVWKKPGAPSYLGWSALQSLSKWLPFNIYFQSESLEMVGKKYKTCLNLIMMHICLFAFGLLNQCSDLYKGMSSSVQKCTECCSSL